LQCAPSLGPPLSSFAMGLRGPLQWRKRHGKGFVKHRKREKKLAEMLVETKKRSAALSSYLDMIPAAFILGRDNEVFSEVKPGYDPKAVKTTTAIVEEAARQESARQAAEKKEEAAAEKKDWKKDKKDKKDKNKNAEDGEKPEKPAKKTMPKQLEPKNRKELVEKLHRRIKELQEDKRVSQSQKDKAAADDRRKLLGGTINDQRKKAENEALADATIGRLDFTPNSSALPFKADQKRPPKSKRLDLDMRKVEFEQRKISRAGKKGKDNAEEVIKEFAMEKAMKRAGGEEVHDDPKKLRKAQRRIDEQKKRSSIKWAARKEELTVNMEEHEQKRKDNLGQIRGKKRKKMQERYDIKQENKANFDD